MKVLILLPVAAFTIFYVILRRRGIDVRRAMLAAITFLGSCVVWVRNSQCSTFRFARRGGD